MTDARGRWVATALCFSLCASSSATAAPKVLVVPATIDGETAEVEAALEAGGHPVVPWAPTREAMTRARTDARAQREADRRTAADAIEAAMQAWLAQDFATMADTLDAAERDHLLALATEPGCRTLWQLQFRLGLSRHDDASAEPYYALALAIDPPARPRRALYGPDVAQAFEVVVEAGATSPRRELTVATTPSDATVAVDCHAVAGDTVALSAGRHVVFAAAPGHVPVARIVEVADAGPLPPIVLTRAESTDAAFAGWPDDTIDLERPSARAVLLPVAASREADVLLSLRPEDAQWHARAWRVHPGPKGSPRRTAEIAGTGAVQAAREALAHVADDGSIRPPAPRVTPPAGPATGPTDDGRPARRCRPAKKCWWLWTLIAAAGAGVAIGLGVGLSGRPESERLQILAPK